MPVLEIETELISQLATRSMMCPLIARHSWPTGCALIAVSKYSADMKQKVPLGPPLGIALGSIYIHGCTVHCDGHNVKIVKGNERKDTQESRK